MTEIEELQKQLLARSQHILHSEDEVAFLRCIFKAEVNPKHAFIVNWIPEQNVDIYHILVNANEVLILECSKDKNSISSFKLLRVLDYRKEYRLSKLHQRLLSCALLLSQQQAD